MTATRDPCLVLGRGAAGKGSGAAATAAVTLPVSELSGHLLFTAEGPREASLPGLVVLEEAALLGIPAIAVDTRGFLPHLALAIQPDDVDALVPWIGGEAAGRRDRARTLGEERARAFAEWDIEPARITRLAEEVDVAIHTPGSQSGLSLDILGWVSESLREPDDREVLRDRVAAVTAGLLALLRLPADPLSRHHTLIARLLERAAKAGRPLTPAQLVTQIQSPPLERLGEMELESAFPTEARTALAQRLNGLLASPLFTSWRRGEPLRTEQLLKAEQRRQRIAVVSVAHLDAREREAAVAVLLHEIAGWLHTQPGCGTPRALLHLDAGTLAMSGAVRDPLGTIFEAAPSAGLACVIAGQRAAAIPPEIRGEVRTWYAGRTTRSADLAAIVERVREAAGPAASEAVAARLAALPEGSFLDLSGDASSLLALRPTLSFVAGALRRPEIKRLTTLRSRRLRAPRFGGAQGVAAAPKEPAAPARERSRVPPGISEAYVPTAKEPGDGVELVYRPALCATASVHYYAAREKVDLREEISALAPLWQERCTAPWGPGSLLRHDVGPLRKTPQRRARHAVLPAEAARFASYTQWAEQLEALISASHPITILRSPLLKALSQPHESAESFRDRLTPLARRRRDEELTRLQSRCDARVQRLKNRMRRAAAGAAAGSPGLSGVAARLSAMMHRKLAAQTAAPRVDAARGDTLGAEAPSAPRDATGEAIETLRARIAELRRDAEASARRLRQDFEPERLELQKRSIPPRSVEVPLGRMILVWTPWHADATGRLRPAFDGQHFGIGRGHPVPATERSVAAASS